MSGRTYIPSSLPVTQLYSPALSWSPFQVGRRTIINKLFFDLAQEEEGGLDAEFLKVPRTDLFLLNPKPSESSVSGPTQGGSVECGGGVLEGGLGSDDETQSLEKYTVSPPLGSPEQSRPEVGVPIPRSPHLAKDLQLSFPAHFASSPQPGKIDVWTHCSQTWLCLKTAWKTWYIPGACVCLRPEIEGRAPGIKPCGHGRNPHCRREWVDSLLLFYCFSSESKI